MGRLSAGRQMFDCNDLPSKQAMKASNSAQNTQYEHTDYCVYGPVAP